MKESTSSGIERTRAPDPSSTSLDTIIVAPELLADASAVTSDRSDEAGTWRPIRAATRPPADDGSSTVRAKHLSDSKSIPVQASPTSRYAFPDITVRVVRPRFELAAPAMLVAVVLSGALMGCVTWLSLREPFDRSRLGATPAGASLTEAGIPPVAASASEPLAIAARPMSRARLSVSDVDVLWGRTEKPIRSLQAAFKRSGDRVSSCLSLAAADPAASSATLAVSLRIRSNGSVLWARPKTDSVGLRPAIPCIAEALREADFPASQDGLRVDAELTFRAP